MKAVFVDNTKGAPAKLMVSTLVIEGQTFAYMNSGAGACSFMFAMNKEQVTALAIALYQAAGEIDDNTPGV